MNKKVIAIHGLGMVGRPLKEYFKDKEFNVRGFDPPQGIQDNIADALYHFLCVPTPFDKDGLGFKLDYVVEAVENIKKVRPNIETVITIKSTVVPGSTQSLQEKYPQFTFLFNPEFLTEANALKDMFEPERQIVGYVTERGRSQAEIVMSMLPNAPYKKIIKASEAELIKYFGNCYLTTKVIFANLMYDFCQKLGIDYDEVSDGAGYDSRIGKSHLNVWYSGYRGYGGTCFPKDIRALIQKGEELGVDVGLLKEVERVNQFLTNGVDY